MPEIMNCRRCGRVFSYLGGAPLCHECRSKDDEEFRNIKEYLYKNPGSTISEVSSALGVSIEKIKRYLKEGRLEIVGDDGNMVLECENCGKAIRSGRFCEDCSKELAKDLEGTVKQIRQSTSKPELDKKSSGIGMRYLNKDGKEKG